MQILKCNQTLIIVCLKLREKCLGVMEVINLKIISHVHQYRLTTDCDRRLDLFAGMCEVCSVFDSIYHFKNVYCDNLYNRKRKIIYYFQTGKQIVSIILPLTKLIM